MKLLIRWLLASIFLPDPVSLDVAAVFADGSKLFDAYGEKEYTVRNGKVEVTTNEGIVLLEKLIEIFCFACLERFSVHGKYVGLFGFVPKV